MTHLQAIIVRKEKVTETKFAQSAIELVNEYRLSVLVFLVTKDRSSLIEYCLKNSSRQSSLVPFLLFGVHSAAACWSFSSLWGRLFGVLSQLPLRLSHLL